MTEKHINEIITESINDYLKENIVDKFTPYTPEEVKMNKYGIGRMGNPSYDNAPKADTAPRDFGTPPTYNEWRDKYYHMPYSQYVKLKKERKI